MPHMDNEEAMKRCKKILISILNYNKHGILLGEFEREFQSLFGKPVPYHLLGCVDILDLTKKFNGVLQGVTVDGVTFLKGLV